MSARGWRGRPWAEQPSGCSGSRVDVRRVVTSGVGDDRGECSVIAEVRDGKRWHLFPRDEDSFVAQRSCAIGWIGLTLAFHTISAQSVPLSSRGTPLTAEEALAVRRPLSVRLSRDGRWIAFVVRQPDAEHNRYDEGVYVVAADGSMPMRRVARGRLPQVVGWSGHEILYLADVGDGRHLWRVPAAGGGARRVSARAIGAGLTSQWHADDLFELRPCAISPDGRYAAFLVFDTTASVRAAAELVTHPIIDTGQAIAEIMHHSFATLPIRAELWLHDLQTGREARLWAAPARPIRGDIPPMFAWSPDAKHLGVVYRLGYGAEPNVRFDRRPIVIIDVPSGRVTPVAERTGVTIYPNWSADGRYLRVLSEGPVGADGTLNPLLEWRYDMATKAFTAVGHEPATKQVYDEFIASYLGWASDPARRVEAAHSLKLNDCSLNAEWRELACIGEAPRSPPEVVLQRLTAAGAPIGELHPLTAMNTGLATAQLGAVTELHWPLAEGLTGSAGLVYPVGYEAGRRYPLIVMLYNLYSGRNFLATTFFPNFAPETFAGRGYAVLLMNVPDRFRAEHASFEQIRWAELGRAAASVDSAVCRVVALGVADSTRLGVMGWSYGSMITDYLLWQWPGRFRAAASSESGLYNPASYWLGTRTFAESWYHGVFGGGPYAGPALVNWQGLSAVYHAGEVRTPVLMEYLTTNITGRELYTALRAHQVPAELVWYPNETHVLSRPADVLASMRRHLDWFDFWLNHEDSRIPANDPELDRWRSLRDEWLRALAASHPR